MNYTLFHVLVQLCSTLPSDLIKLLLLNHSLLVHRLALRNVFHILIGWQDWLGGEELLHGFTLRNLRVREQRPQKRAQGDTLTFSPQNDGLSG